MGGRWGGVSPVDRVIGPLIECGHLVRVGRQGGSDFPRGCLQLHPAMLGEDMARKISVSVDHNLCVGNQMCISIATKALTLNDDRQAIPADVDGDTEEIILEAAEQCPMAAISVMDAETGEQLFP